MLPVSLLARGVSDAGGGDVIEKEANEDAKNLGDETSPLGEQKQDREEKNNDTAEEVENDPSNDEDGEEDDDEEDADDAELDDEDTVEADDKEQPPLADGVDKSDVKGAGNTEESLTQRETGDILKKVQKFLKGKEFVFSVDSRRDLIRMSVGGPSSTYNVIFDAREENRQLFVYACIPNRVPEDRRIEMAQFVARANYGMAIGGFEFDMSDGEIRFKTTVDVEEGELSCKMVQNMYDVAFGCAERYFCGIMGVCYAGKDAAEAVAEAEGNDRATTQ